MTVVWLNRVRRSLTFCQARVYKYWDGLRLTLVTLWLLDSSQLFCLVAVLGSRGLSHVPLYPLLNTA
jgi:hypothetical protein